MAPPNRRVANAYRAMKNLGIEEGVVKPVLKNLLKLYDNEWELIEEENYRALADSIFSQQEDSQEAGKVAKSKKKKKKAAKPRVYSRLRKEPVEEAQLEDEDDEDYDIPLKRFLPRTRKGQVPYFGSSSKSSQQREPVKEAQLEEEEEEEEEPLVKRLRPRNNKGRISSYGIASRSTQIGTSLKLPKVESEESPETCTRQQSRELIELSQSSAGNVIVGSHSPPTPLLVSYKRKRSVSPTPLFLPEQSKSPLTRAADRTKPIDSIAAPPRKNHRNQGKEPIRFPGANVDPGIILLPKQHSRSSSPLKPKKEPFVDETPYHEAPIAVIHPGESDNENSSSGIRSAREINCAGPLVPQSADTNDEYRDDQATSSERRKNSTLQNIADESSSPELEVASSPGGEVKVSFTCNSAAGPDFRMPGIDQILKMMEDKCLRSFKILPPSFSAKNFLQDICEGIFELGTNSSDESHRIMDGSDTRGESNNEGSSNDQPAAVRPQVQEIPQSNGLDELVRNDNLIEGLCGIERETEKCSSENADPPSSSINAKCAESECHGLLPASSDVDGCTEKKNNTTKSSILICKENLEKDLEQTTSLSPMVIHELCGLDDGCSEAMAEEEVIPDSAKLLANSGETVKDLMGFSKTSIIAKCNAKPANLQMSRLGNETDKSTYHCKDVVVSDSSSVEKKEENNLEDAGSCLQVTDGEHQLVPVMSLLDAYDIGRGQENIVITCSDEIGKNCSYNCTGNCLLSATCACRHASGSDFAYNEEGLLKEEFLEKCISMNRNEQKQFISYCAQCPLERCKQHDDPCRGHLTRKFIKECWWNCGCGKHCGNRVVQRGITHKLQVFMTPEGKGLGVRPLEDLPKGSFVCEYAGEILTSLEISKRISQSPDKEVDTYSVLLDADWASQGVLKDEDALFLDANFYGNVARFINHRCFDPNLISIPVEMETPDRRYYHLAFFTSRNVEALEELTWDYGVDFDDQDPPLKAFQCCCGSEFCRNIASSRRSRAIVATGSK